MGLSKSLENKKFDSRLIEWNLKNNVISQEEYDQYMTALSDASQNAAPIDIETEDPDSEEEAQSGNGSLVF